MFNYFARIIYRFFIFMHKALTEDSLNSIMILYKDAREKACVFFSRSYIYIYEFHNLPLRKCENV